MAKDQDVPTEVLNERFCEKIASDDPLMFKSASDAVNDFTRMKVREEGFWRKILPPVTITSDELDRQVDTDGLVKVIDKEPASPAAMSVSFAQAPVGTPIMGSRYRVMFNRLLTPKFYQDVEKLRTYNYDIRQVLTDNAIKDMLAEEDSKAVLACQFACGGVADAVNPITGFQQWTTLQGGMTRTNIVEALKILPSGPARVRTATILCSTRTYMDIMKWHRDEAGGDISEEIMRKGLAETELLGCKWIVTIKENLVPYGRLMLFAEPKFLGKHFLLEDATLFIERKAYMLEFFAYESLGSAIGNCAALAICDIEANLDFTA